MPTSSELEEAVSEIVTARFKRFGGPLDGHTRFREDLGADSLDLLEMVFTIEERFGLSIPNSDIADIRTVDDAVRYVERLRG